MQESEAMPVSPEPEDLILVVDDDRDLSALVRRWLELAGFKTRGFQSAEALIDALSQTMPAAICLDLGLPGMSGMDALTLVRAHHRTVPVIILTGDSTVDSVVAAMSAGAYDYLPKPLDRTKLVTTVGRAVEQYHLSTRVAQLEQNSREDYAGIVGRSGPMRQLFREIERVAASDISVLVHGESGTGKELVAQAIHTRSARSAGPLVSVNCAAIADTLQDSELFGHERGAFTGAAQQRVGRFEQADGGTLFLDEVAELALPLQAKLLRVLQERRFRRVGGTDELRSDFRLIAATHRDLATMVAEGSFREDLYFRLAVFELDVPSLRARTGDLPILARAFLREIVGGGTSAELSPEVEMLFEGHPWPGNVRELRNVLQRAAVLADGVIRVEHLPLRLREARPAAATTETRALPSVPEVSPRSTPTLDAIVSLEEVEKRAIEHAMEATGGNLSEVCRRLNIGRTTLYRKLKSYGFS